MQQGSEEVPGQPGWLGQNLQRQMDTSPDRQRSIQILLWQWTRAFTGRGSPPHTPSQLGMLLPQWAAAGAGWGLQTPGQAEMGTQLWWASAWSHSDLISSLSKTQHSPNARRGQLSRAKPTTAPCPAQRDERGLKWKSTGWHQRHLPRPSLARHSLQSLRCPSILIRVLALAPVTDCKGREARRVQPPKMPQPATHRAPAVASREIGGPAPHLYP